MTSAIPGHLYYTSDHEWVSDPGGPIARVGITDYAQEALGDVVFVDLPGLGETVNAGEACGEIESTKSVSELFSPVSGKVEAVNDAVLDAPEAVNSDPYGAGWLFAVRTDGQLPPVLLDASGYAALPDVSK
jgi:glycine cleavage system H protein